MQKSHLGKTALEWSFATLVQNGRTSDLRPKMQSLPASVIQLSVPSCAHGLVLSPAS